MTDGKSLLLCYNRGCGQEFNPKENKEDACFHHPGFPVFHDAYKSWSCCKKKSTDFTEFLNIKGCTNSSHSNEKPPQPEKPAVDKSKAAEVIEYRPPVESTALKRPPFETLQTTMTPTISPTLIEQIKGLSANKSVSDECATISIGESCKNKSCKGTYKGPESNDEVCVHHPGFPVFHEGLKFWSCCQKKKVTDFSIFLELPGCTKGQHMWISKDTGKKIDCRMDWHQTGLYVVVAIYAKKYQPNKSSVKLNPIRLTAELFFPEEDSSYRLDLELRGVIDIENSSVTMLPTKVEIKMKKAEPGSWAKLDFPRSETKQTDKSENEESENLSQQVDAVDLSDL